MEEAWGASAVRYGEIILGPTISFPANQASFTRGWEFLKRWEVPLCLLQSPPLLTLSGLALGFTTLTS